MDVKTEAKSFADVQLLAERITKAMADDNGQLDPLDCLAALGMVVATMFAISDLGDKLDSWVNTMRAAVSATSRNTGRMQ